MGLMPWPQRKICFVAAFYAVARQATTIFLLLLLLLLFLMVSDKWKYDKIHLNLCLTRKIIFIWNFSKTTMCVSTYIYKIASWLLSFKVANDNVRPLLSLTEITVIFYILFLDYRSRLITNSFGKNLYSWFYSI